MGSASPKKTEKDSQVANVVGHRTVNTFNGDSFLTEVRWPTTFVTWESFYLFSGTFLKKIGFVPVCRCPPTVQVLYKRVMSFNLFSPTQFEKKRFKLNKKPANLTTVLLGKFFPTLKTLGDSYLVCRKLVLFFQIIRTNNDSEGWHD